MSKARNLVCGAPQAVLEIGKAKARWCDASQLCGAGRTDKAEEVALHEGPAEDPVGPALDAQTPL